MLALLGSGEEYADGFTVTGEIWDTTIGGSLEFKAAAMKAAHQ
jgi:hypothetical protein